MATKTPGGRMSSRIALTLEATVALEVGDPVHMTGAYTCVKADGTKKVVGIVTTANKVRGAAGAVAQIPGDVAVESPFHMVLPVKAAAGAIAAGDQVGINAAGLLAVDGAGVSHIGTALTASALNAGAMVDVAWD